MIRLKTFVRAACLACVLLVNGYAEEADRYSKKYLHQLFSIQDKAESEYFTYGGKMRLWFLGLADKAGVKLSEDSLDDMRNYTTFQAELIAAGLHEESEGDSFTEFNARIQSLIGANVVVPEKN